MGRSIYLNFPMKFAFATALLAFSQVQAAEVATEVEASAEWGNLYGSSLALVQGSLSKRLLLNGHGHHSYSDLSSSDYSSLDSLDYSSSDYGLGYRSLKGRRLHYRYAPKCYNGRYWYGSRYASLGGVYKGALRSYPLRSYSACLGCSKPLLAQPLLAQPLLARKPLRSSALLW